MQRVIEYIISENTSPVTILDFLKREGFSRHILSSMKNASDTIILNGERGFGRSVLKPQDHLVITVPETESGENIIRTKMELKILYEDEDILVINKPADMPVHPSAGNYENTLANGIAWYFEQKGETFVYRCINRLDRDTTGLIVLAKHALSAAVLSQAMRSREIHRTYQAFALGETAASGTIDAPIARLNGSLIQRTVDFASGERSVTHYRTLAHCSVFSHLELNLETGRTHQIRVHMAYIGHPLLGDTLYNKTPGTFPRQALHSASLSFVHPITGEPLNFHAPLPEDMQNLLT